MIKQKYLKLKVVRDRDLSILFYAEKINKKVTLSRKLRRLHKKQNFWTNVNNLIMKPSWIEQIWHWKAVWYLNLNFDVAYFDHDLNLAKYERLEDPQ